MKLTDEVTLSALRGFNKRPGYSQLERMRDALESVLPHLTDDGAAAPPADKGAANTPAAESATTTAAPSSPHLREALEALAADWRSLPYDPDSMSTIVLRHCGAQVARALDDNPAEGTAPAIDREALARAAHHYFCVRRSEPNHDPRPGDFDKADEILEILALIGDVQ